MQPPPEHGTNTQAGAPESGHSVGRPANVPKVNKGRLALWLGVPFVVALLTLVVFWDA